MRKIYLSLAAAFVVTAATAQGTFKTNGSLLGGNPTTKVAVGHAQKALTEADAERMAVKGLKAPTAQLAKTNARMARRADLPTELISAQPEGTLHEGLYRVSTGYYSFWGYIIYYSTDGMACNVVTTDDGSLYYQNPFSTFQTGTWIKGNKGEGDTINVQFPQLVYQEDYEGTVYSYYAWKMVLSTYEEDGVEYQTFVPDSVSQTIQYVWRNDSLVKLGDELIGLGDETGLWYGYGDDYCVMNKVSTPTVVPPTGAAEQDYSFAYGYNAGQPDCYIVKVVKDGNDIYVKGIYDSMPDAWVKGTIDGNTVDFPSGQYLGIDASTASHVFLFPTEIDSVYYEDYDWWSTSYSIGEKLTFDYDATTGTLTTNDAFMTNKGCNQQDYLTVFNGAKLAPWEEKAATPQDPSFNDFSEYDENYGYAYAAIYIPKFGTDGTVLDGDKMYYNLYLDDEILTLYTDEYTMLSEDMTDIPLNYADNNDIYCSASVHYIYSFATGYDKFGVQSFYTGGGETRSSNIVYYTIESEGIGDVIGDKAGSVKSVSYTDLQGRKVANPSKGIYLKSLTFADGTVKTVKCTRK